MRHCFEQSDLNNDAELKLALQYENFQKVSKELRSSLVQHPDWGKFIPNHKSDSDNFQSLFCSLKQAHELSSRSFISRIAPVKRLLPEFFVASIPGIDTIAYKRLVEKLESTQSPSIRKLLFLNFFKFEVSLSKMIDAILGRADGSWVSENYNTDGICLNTTINKLGLYQYKERKAGEKYFLFTFSGIDCYKPNWFDACLSFYFSENDESEEHGYTRCLRKGKRGYKEWLISRKKLVKNQSRIDQFSKLLKDVEVFELKKTENFSSIKGEYRKVAMSRIIAERR